MDTTRSGLVSTQGAPLDLARLVVVHGKSSSAPALLEQGRWAIGRVLQGPQAVVLDDDEVSRAHAAVEWDQGLGAWTLEDLGSRNGTFLNGRRVNGRAKLSDQSVLRVGGCVLLYVEARLLAGTHLEPASDRVRGPSLAMQRIRGELARVGPQPLPVLLRGETGVGKEVLAGELHRLSQRRGKLVPVNCSAISPALAESELFGHVAGSFTGATGKSAGLFAAAQGGTLFLDEVGELPLDLQPKLLRALAQGEVRAVGSSDPSVVDVRIVSATHRDLAEAVAAGTFRADLLARLSGWVLEVPPLRARRDDVLPLAQAAVDRAGAEGLSADAAEALVLHDWPGNTRELELLIAAAAIRAERALLEPTHLGERFAALLCDRPARPRTTAVPLELRVPRDRPPSKEGLALAVAHFEGNVSRVADYFGKDRRQVYRWAESLGVELKAKPE